MSGINTGDVISGRYRIAELIGTGGMAQVFRADDLDLGRSVAIKVLSTRYARDPQFVSRFRREASAAAKLNHPNIVQVFDRGEAEGTYYIVMEYLPGPDLKDIIRKRGAIDPDETIEAGLQILSALTVAHRNQVIHRDIKPQNVIMAEDGLLKVTDFGIAQAGTEAELTEAGSVIGTAQYLSPEQAQGGEITGSSDCYSVGIVLYEMLTGRVPFDGERPVTVAMKQVHEPPVPPTVFEPNIPPDLEQVVLKAMAKRPADRFRSADDFSAALLEVRNKLDAAGATRVLGADETGVTRMMGAVPPTEKTRVVGASTPPPSRPTPEPAPPEKAPRRVPWPWLLAGLVVLLLLVAGIWALTGGGGDQNGQTSTTQQVAVPSGLVGMSEDAARQTVIDAKLRPEVENVESTAQEEGKVVSVLPDEGTMVEEGDTVTLRVGSGPEEVEVPDVRGMSQADAVARLRRDGFQPRAQRRNDDTVEKGNVINQAPSPGTSRPKGSQVTIVVSDGPEQATVPNLVGRSQSTALDMLRAEGLQANPVEVPSERDQGTVVRQDPAPGSRVDPGATVRIEVSAGPQLVSVPSVQGQSRDRATQLLQDAGFNVSVQTSPSSEPLGTVTGQSPGPNQQVPAGSTITLTVSDGPAVEPTPTAPGVPQPQPDGTPPSGPTPGQGPGSGVPAPPPGNSQ